MPQVLFSLSSSGEDSNLRPPGYERYKLKIRTFCEISNL